MSMSYQERWRYGAIEESDDLFNYREFLIREIEGVSRFRGLGWLETNDLEVMYFKLMGTSPQKDFRRKECGVE